MTPHSLRSLLALPLAVTLSLPAAEAAPLVLENCGRELRFEAPVERAVTVGQATTEIFYALGLSGHVLGTSVWFSPVLPEYREINEGIERISDNDPSFEAVVRMRPQLVTAQYEWHIGPQGSVASRDQFADLGISTYVLPTDCSGKDNSTGGDGTRTEPYSPESLYRGVAELAQIFGEETKGIALVEALKAREASAVAAASKSIASESSAVFWFSSPEMQSDPFVAGRNGPPGWMMKVLGLRNVVESEEEWPSVSWETIARADPSVIVVAQMDRRRFEADDAARKIAFLKNDPVTSQMQAVRNDRIVIMDAHAMDPSLRNFTALEELAAALTAFEQK